MSKVEMTTNIEEKVSLTVEETREEIAVLQEQRDQAEAKLADAIIGYSLAERRGDKSAMEDARKKVVSAESQISACETRLKVLNERVGYFNAVRLREAREFRKLEWEETHKPRIPELAKKGIEAQSRVIESVRELVLAALDFRKAQQEITTLRYIREDRLREFGGQAEVLPPLEWSALQLGRVRIGEILSDLGTLRFHGRRTSPMANLSRFASLIGLENK